MGKDFRSFDTGKEFEFLAKLLDTPAHMIDESKSELRPLCVDLDGTLVKTDTFAQALLLLIRTRPAALLSIPRWASRGLAAFKQRVAQEIELDPIALPFHSDFLGFLKSEHEKGRKLLLVTASDQSVARRVADHLGFFSDVIASDGLVNLKAARKRDALVVRFGEDGFDYAGNSSDDLIVWESAAETIAVNPSGSVRRALCGKAVTFFEDRPARWKGWLKALRVHQWIKNVLVFLPMLLAHELSDPLLYGKAVIAFFAFSCAASAIYLFNDLFDLHADQHHPRKHKRPLAAGDVGLLSAGVVSPILVLVALGLASFLSASYVVVLLVYLLLTTLYSWHLKQMVLIDVITLSAFYAIRILAGTAAYGVETSPWLIAFSISIFLSLGVVKRYAELREAVREHPEKIRARGRGYHAWHLPWLVGLGVGSGVLSAVVLALYIHSEKVMQFYKTPAILWVLCPMVLYWIGRIWWLAARGELSDDPLDFAARDPQTWILGGVGAVVLIAGTL